VNPVSQFKSKAALASLLGFAAAMDSPYMYSGSGGHRITSESDEDRSHGAQEFKKRKKANQTARASRKRNR
jgi:hypothetical protein